MRLTPPKQNTTQLLHINTGKQLAQNLAKSKTQVCWLGDKRLDCSWSASAHGTKTAASISCGEISTSWKCQQLTTTTSYMLIGFVCFSRAINLGFFFTFILVSKLGGSFRFWWWRGRSIANRVSGGTDDSCAPLTVIRQRQKNHLWFVCLATEQRNRVKSVFDWTCTQIWALTVPCTCGGTTTHHRRWFSSLHAQSD